MPKSTVPVSNNVMVAGLIIGFVMLYGIGRYQSIPTATPTPTQETPASVKVLSFDCIPAESGAPIRAKVMIQNLGPALPYSKVIVRFGEQVADNYISTGQFPTNSISSADVFATAANNATSCQLVSVQDHNGNGVRILQ